MLKNTVKALKIPFLDMLGMHKWICHLWKLRFMHSIQTSLKATGILLLSSIWPRLFYPCLIIPTLWIYAKNQSIRMHLTIAFHSYTQWLGIILTAWFLILYQVCMLGLTIPRYQSQRLMDHKHNLRKHSLFCCFTQPLLNFQLINYLALVLRWHGWDVNTTQSIHIYQPHPVWKGMKMFV